METVYPSIPGLPYQITEHSGLAQYIGYFFALAIIAAGILAVIVLTIGGIRLIMSEGSPEKRKEAADMIKGSVLGMILVVSSFMLLRTINPAFIEPSLTPLPPVGGIYYFNGSDKKPAPMSEPNTSNVPEGYNQILYDCDSGPDLFIWKYPKINFEGIENTFVETISCQSATGISGVRSFKLAFKTPGVYYFLKDGCSGYMSGANVSGGQLQEPFKNKVKSIKILNDPANSRYYGVIFHSSDNPLAVGKCTFPRVIEQCQGIPELPKKDPDDPNEETFTISNSATVFLWNNDKPEISGTGVDFYSEPWGKSLGARAGVYSLKNQEQGTYWKRWAGSHNDQNPSLVFNYSGVNRPQSYKQLYKSFYQRPGSIYLNGNYLAALYSVRESPSYSAGESPSDESAVTACQVFFKNVFNIKTTEFYAIGNYVNSVHIFPIK